MTPERFEEVAARFERVSRASPRGYRLLVLALGALGYAVLGAVVGTSALLLALVVVAGVLARNLIFAKLAIPLGVTTWALLRALWVRFERPRGVELRRARCPALFDEIERLRRLGRVPRVARVLVDDAMNASVVQTPRLGLPPANDLVLGLPLLSALSPDTFRAVLAHELGHLSGRHGAAGARAYRLRRTWTQVATALAARRSWAAGIVRPFLRWYAPYYSAASFALAREQEREADRFSAAATSPRTAADALAAVVLADHAIDRGFWPAFSREAWAGLSPPQGFLGPLARALKAAPGLDADAVLRRALLRRARGGDTHPALGERLEALGEAARVPPPPAVSAAEHFLGPALRDVQVALDQAWRERLSPGWAAARARHHEREARLASLEAAAAARPLEAGEAWERASLTEDLLGAAEALPLARAAVAAFPGHAPAQFGLGRLLLAQGREDGLTHVERAMALDPDAQLPGAQLVAAHLVATGREAEARPWIARAAALEAEGEAADAERRSVGARDALEAHRLAPAGVKALVGGLRGDPRVARVYLARKRLKHLPDRAPVFVVGVVARRRWWQLERAGDAARLAAELAKGVPAQPRTFVVVRGRGTAALFRKVKRAGGAPVA